MYHQGQIAVHARLMRLVDFTAQFSIQVMDIYSPKPFQVVNNL